MISLGNPVMGTIRPHSDPPGPYWRVTATFGQIDADHPTPHQGVDIGNMKCGDPVVAVADGTVSLAAFVGAALVVRVKHPQFPGYESGYAHLSSKVVALGQAVKRGQILGTLGMTGATACHLHFGLKLNGVEVDSWPLLEQNQEQDMRPIPPAKFAPLTGKQGKVVLPAGATLRADRFNNAKALQLYPAGTAFTPLAQANDGDPSPTSTRWYGGMAGTSAGVVFGWLQEAALALADAPADCGDEVAAAVAPLNEKIAKAKVALG